MLPSEAATYWRVESLRPENHWPSSASVACSTAWVCSSKTRPIWSQTVTNIVLRDFSMLESWVFWCQYIICFLVGLSQKLSSGCWWNLQLLFITCIKAATHEPSRRATAVQTGDVFQHPTWRPSDGRRPTPNNIQKAKCRENVNIYRKKRLIIC